MHLHFRSDSVGEKESGVVGLRTSGQLVGKDKYGSMSDLFLLTLHEFRGRESAMKIDVPERMLESSFGGTWLRPAVGGGLRKGILWEWFRPAVKNKEGD